jgi:subtilisin family serine protease
MTSLATTLIRRASPSKIQVTVDCNVQDPIEDFNGESDNTPNVLCTYCSSISPVPNDCNGHGTHVAGIIGADARDIGAPQPFVGVAPEVSLGVYKVLSCEARGVVDIIMRVGLLVNIKQTLIRSQLSVD